MPPTIFGLFVFAAVSLVAVSNVATHPRRRATVGGAVVVVALATGVQVVRIGHSRAKAAWSDVGSSGAGQ